MQIVVNLDPDLEALLRREASERNLEFDEVLNDRLRDSLSSREAQRFLPRGGGKEGMTAHEAVDRIRELRKGTTLAGVSIKELVDEGRKHWTLHLSVQMSVQMGGKNLGVFGRNVAERKRPYFVDLKE